jgi:hypothetical protein
MKPWVLLRVASILTLVHAVMHTIGGVFGKTPPGAAGVAVAAMQANHFAFMGAMRTYWDFQRGLGLALTVFLTAEGLVFWMLASLAKANARQLRPILVTFFFAYVAFAIVSMRYFFLLAAVMELIIALLLGLACAAARSSVGQGRKADAVR